MKAKAALASVFALMLAAAVVCGEKHRLHEEAAAAESAAVNAIRTAAKEVDVTN